jgi:uncharacterized protein YkwD
MRHPRLRSAWRPAALAAALVCVVAATTPFSAPGSAATGSVAGASPLDSAILEQINAFRASKGMPPFVSSPVLQAFALSHAQDMLAKGYFGHDAPGGPTALERLTSFYGAEGYTDLSNTGENISLSAGSGDAATIVQSWIDDQQHQDILLGHGRGALYTDAGVAAVTVDSAPGFYAGYGRVTVITAEFGPPQPVYGQSVVVATVSGTVLVQPPGATKFTPLTGAAVIDAGTQVDTTKGRVRLTSVADDLGNVQTADFYKGQFAVSYVPDVPGDTSPPSTTTTTTPATPPPLLTNLELTGSLKGCATTATKRLLAGQDKKRPPKKKPKPKGPTTRSLWGHGIGHFRTQAKYAAATVRGTFWLTQDTCTGTRVQVLEGVVDVLDLKKNVHELVQAGNSLFVPKPK